MAQSKLPVFATAGEAWRSTFAAISAMPATALVAAVLIFILTATQIGISRWLLNPADITDAVALGSKTRLFNFLMAVVQTALVAPFAIAVHRFILLDEVTRSYALAPASTRYRRFVAFAVLMNLAWSVPEAVEHLARVAGDGLYGSFGLLAVVIGLFVLVLVATLRLGVVLPAAAVDAPDAEWKGAWALTRGYFWRMLLTVLATLLPVLIPATVLTILVIGVVQGGGYIAVVLSALLWAAGLLLTTTAGIAVLSHIYRRLHTTALVELPR